MGNGVKIQNNVSVYEGVTLEDDVFCGPSMVFTNVINPRSHVTRKNEYKETLVKKGASIGANAVVTKDVADFAIAVGVPARTIRQRFSDAIASRLDELAWWDWEHEKLHSALQDFRSLSAEEFLERHGG